MTCNNTSTLQSTKLKKTLTLFPVIMIGVAYMQPMTLFDTFGIVTEKSYGHVATAYAIALVAILFTAFSYGKLVRRYPSAGSAYTYAQKAISPHVGFMVGWSSLLDYLFMPMINILLAKIYLQDIAPGIPSWIFVLLLVTFMTLTNLRGIKTVANFNGWIVILQIIVIAIITVMVIWEIFHGAAGGRLLSMRPFWSNDAHLTPIIAGATILCFSFLGFDGISSLSEETIDAERTIPKAIFMTALIGGILFIAVSYFIQLYFPTAASFNDTDASQPEIMLQVAGRVLQLAILLFSCITVLASGMAAHAGVSRLMYVMGRDGVFPGRFFGFIHREWATPTCNILLVGAIALLAIWFKLETATALINFGALVAFSFVNLSVIFQFFLREKRNRQVKDIINFLILPLCGVGTVGVLWANLERSSMVLGLVWATIGFLYLVSVTRGFRSPVPQYNDDAR